MPINDNKQSFRVPEKFYRVGELVYHTSLSRQTIHNYTAMGLIREAKWTNGGHRLYDESVFGKLAQIAKLKKTKTLLEIKKTLNSEKAESWGDFQIIAFITRTGKISFTKLESKNRYLQQGQTYDEGKTQLGNTAVLNCSWPR